MPKDASKLPDLIKGMDGGGGKPDAGKSEADKINAKIDKAFEKLAKKMRGHADKAKGKIDGDTKPDKRAKLLRRFELYADAANHLEDRLAHRQG